MDGQTKSLCTLENTLAKLRTGKILETSSAGSLEKNLEDCYKYFYMSEPARRGQDYDTKTNAKKSTNLMWMDTCC